MLSTDTLLNAFAVCCFRDTADADYIAARMAFRATLTSQYLWASQQAFEKYLKGILLLYRIPATDVLHSLQKGMSRVQASAKLSLDLTAGSQDFIRYVDRVGRFRYQEVSPVVFGHDIIRLDRAVWEIRRYCTLSDHGRRAKLVDGEPPPMIRIDGGFLEQVVDNRKHPAHEPLLWQNAFFGRRRRRTVSLEGSFRATNSILFLHPEILDEVLKYIFLPKDVKSAYRSLRDKSGAPQNPKA